MEIVKTTVHIVTFQVRALVSSGHDKYEQNFGSTVNNLKEAIDIFEIAKISEPEHDWFIYCQVQTKIS